jgi:predicted nucleotidyltransferase
MITDIQINNITDKIVEKYNPEKVILFGSCAKGTYNDDSDLDFIIIKETNLPKHKRGIELRRFFYGLTIPLDFKIYTTNEYEQEKNNKFSFLYSALAESKTLYDREK